MSKYGVKVSKSPLSRSNEGLEVEGQSQALVLDWLKSCVFSSHSGQLHAGRSCRILSLPAVLNFITLRNVLLILAGKASSITEAVKIIGSL